MTFNYLAAELRQQQERGPQPDEGFYRMKVTGDGSTRWLNLTPEQFEAIIAAIETD